MTWKCPKCGREFSRQNQDHYFVKPRSIDEYIAAQDEKYRSQLREVREILRKALPDAEELSEYDTSKGTIRIPYDQPLSEELIRRIAQWCFEKYST